MIVLKVDNKPELLEALGTVKDTIGQSFTIVLGERTRYSFPWFNFEEKYKEYSKLNKGKPLQNEEEAYNELILIRAKRIKRMISQVRGKKKDIFVDK